MNQAEQKLITSPYRRGADFGFIFGIYLSVMFFGSIFSQQVPLTGLLSFVLMLAVPVVIFLFIRRFNNELNGCATFPMMWMLGVVTFVCGILISGSLLVVYMKWIEPDFVVSQLENIAKLGSQPELAGTALDEAGDIASQMIKANFIPTPIAIVSELIMAAIVSGSLLSIIISVGLSLHNRHRRPTPKA